MILPAPVSTVLIRQLRFLGLLGTRALFVLAKIAYRTLTIHVLVHSRIETRTLPTGRLKFPEKKVLLTSAGSNGQGSSARE